MDPKKIFSAADFVLGLTDLAQLPAGDIPEVAFAGRSNVGKSSLLNALTGRKDLARTSNTPGRTQQLNFFTLADRLYLVDMPGYGYAKVSKTMRSAWDKLIFDYLRGRPTLRCVYVLVDSRHGLKDSDIMLMEMLDEAAVPYRIVLTKADKEKQAAKTARAVEDKLAAHAAAWPQVHITSSLNKTGIEELQEMMASYCTPITE